MSINICGIPKRLDGEFYCPYCNFSSYDIEDFAIAMCWNCVFNDEQEEENLIDSTENRRLVIDSLLNNPAGYRQIRLAHRNDSNGRCATGLMAEAFHLSLLSHNNSGVNNELRVLLDDDAVTDGIIRMNDSEGFSFRMIAEKLAMRWGFNINDFKEDK